MTQLIRNLIAVGFLELSAITVILAADVPDAVHREAQRMCETNVTLQSFDGTVATLFRQMAEQVDFEFRIGFPHQNLLERRVKIDWHKKPVFDAIVELSRQLKLRIEIKVTTMSRRAAIELSPEKYRADAVLFPLCTGMIELAPTEQIPPEQEGQKERTGIVVRLTGCGRTWDVSQAPKIQVHCPKSGLQKPEVAFAVGFLDEDLYSFVVPPDSRDANAHTEGSVGISCIRSLSALIVPLGPKSERTNGNVRAVITSIDRNKGSMTIQYELRAANNDDGDMSSDHPILAWTSGIRIVEARVLESNGKPVRRKANATSVVSDAGEGEIVLDTGTQEPRFLVIAYGQQELAEVRFDSRKPALDVRFRAKGRKGEEKLPCGN